MDSSDLCKFVATVVGASCRLVLILYLWSFVGASWAVMFGVLGGGMFLAGALCTGILFADRR
jgi:hypothetical protein